MPGLLFSQWSFVFWAAWAHASFGHDLDLLSRFQTFRGAKSVDHPKAVDRVVETRHAALAKRFDGFARPNGENPEPQRSGCFDLRQAQAPDRIDRSSKCLVGRRRHALGGVNKA